MAAAATSLRVSAATRAWQSIAHASGIAEIEGLKRSVHALQAALDAAAVRRSAALAAHDGLVAESAAACADPWPPPWCHSSH